MPYGGLADIAHGALRQLRLDELSPLGGAEIKGWLYEIGSHEKLEG